MTEPDKLPDTRKPSPPYGYSCRCERSEEEQIQIVAEYTAHRIRPNRIAYRVGIDLAFIEQLLNGSAHAPRFSRLVQFYRGQRRAQRLQQSYKVKGIAQAELQAEIEREFKQAR